ncbi:hypothetical protein B0H13DRAFT_1906619 [Mycena leptocephala]|nr:hypothetical protein B0H13DRAFT_1906619 [Mycena leptocephala]
MTRVGESSRCIGSVWWDEKEETEKGGKLESRKTDKENGVGAGALQDLCMHGCTKTILFRERKANKTAWQTGTRFYIGDVVREGGGSGQRKRREENARAPRGNVRKERRVLSAAMPSVGQVRPISRKAISVRCNVASGIALQNPMLQLMFFLELRFHHWRSLFVRLSL